MAIDQLPPPGAATIERQPSPDDYRALRIRNDFPRAIAEAIEGQMGKRAVGGMFNRGLIGESIGFVEAGRENNNPLRSIRTTVHGMENPTKTSPIEGKPGQYLILEKQPQFNVNTQFELPNHTFIDQARTEQLIRFLQSVGYQVNINVRPTGWRDISIITKNGQSFELDLGWATADEKAAYHRQSAQTTQYDSQRDDHKRKEQEVFESRDESKLKLGITPTNRQHIPGGINLDSTNTVLSYLEQSKELTEVVATGLVQVLSGKQFPTLRMDWLSPHVVAGMSMRQSSAVEGRVDATALVEQQVREEIGLERLAGLPRTTMLELMRIAADLKDPKRSRFMKKHGFKQSSGAVFWGEPGTGKSYAGQALAEEAGCERVVLKISGFMTSYMHESARRVGEEIRKIKQRASGDRQIIIQIDEADTILRPIEGRDSASNRDASEMRSMLLQEFEEPSDVFYVLTTNLDPRDPSQADPAIVRNQRLGNLVAFGLPDAEGRDIILRKETDRRRDDDLSWESVDFDSLRETTNGFSQADLQEVLTIGASMAYDPETDGAVVNQQHLEQAVNIVKSRKLQEQQIRRGTMVISQMGRPQ
ncbi:MAG TPA: ATP-binding protein [Patescibacteria group bacterium]|nr:ATP-binding protein [Patescibacteria group bacterium]